MSLSLIPELACVAVCVAAAITDLGSRRIPNSLTLPSIIIGVALNFGIETTQRGLVAGLRDGLAPSLVGGGLLFIVFLLFHAARAVGMGDVKLMAAVGAFLMWPHVIWTLAYTLLAGAALGILYAIRTRSVAAVGRNMLLGLKRLARRDARREPLTLHHMPYALAILLGVMATSLRLHWDTF